MYIWEGNCRRHKPLKPPLLISHNTIYYEMDVNFEIIHEQGIFSLDRENSDDPDPNPNPQEQEDTEVPCTWQSEASADPTGYGFIIWMKAKSGFQNKNIRFFKKTWNGAIQF